jgi:hypothetical protein
MPVYECPRCFRRVVKPEGTYYCSECGPNVLMRKIAEDIRYVKIFNYRPPDEGTLYCPMRLYLARNITDKRKRLEQSYITLKECRKCPFYRGLGMGTVLCGFIEDLVSGEVERK